MFSGPLYGTLETLMKAWRVQRTYLDRVLNNVRESVDLFSFALDGEAERPYDLTVHMG